MLEFLCGTAYLADKIRTLCATYTGSSTLGSLPRYITPTIGPILVTGYSDQLVKVPLCRVTYNL